jgi:hypothetical protein
MHLMDAQLLENLLQQEESATLDFKRDQYAFAGASTTQKGELLKDILALANAWRQTDAHVLIGVEEVRGGRSIPCGIPSAEHLQDHDIQQFVHGKTNRELSFSYAPFPFNSVEIGVITVPLQERPIYLIKDYGGLRANVVYVRRGSSTGEATPDEVLRMASGTLSLGVPSVLQVEFADIKNREKHGLGLRVLCKPREIPPLNRIPLFGEAPTPFSAIDYGQNRQYYRDVAEWFRDFAHLCPVGLVVPNPSSILAEHVIVTVQIESASGLALLDARDMKPFPSSSWSLPVAPSGRYSRRIDVAQYANRYEILAELGNVQPGTEAWSQDVFYIGARMPQLVQADLRISANNLRVPMVLRAEIEIETSTQPMAVQEILALARAKE